MLAPCGRVTIFNAEVVVFSFSLAGLFVFTAPSGSNPRAFSTVAWGDSTESMADGGVGADSGLLVLSAGVGWVEWGWREADSTGCLVGGSVGFRSKAKMGFLVSSCSFWVDFGSMLLGDSETLMESCSGL